MLACMYILSSTVVLMTVTMMITSRVRRSLRQSSLSKHLSRPYQRKAEQAENASVTVQFAKPRCMGERMPRFNGGDSAQSRNGQRKEEKRRRTRRRLSLRWRRVSLDLQEAFMSKEQGAFRALAPKPYGIR